MSETLTAVIVDAATGIVVERELTAEEIAERVQFDQAEQAELDAKAAARASALAKLAELGLTAEEIAAL